ncbi:MAG: hypothetical protein AAGK32_03345, partial [Actinomycetota bacterium]
MTITAVPTADRTDGFPGRLRDLSEWSDDDAVEAGLPVLDVPIVTVGGGLGSLALIDVLRLAGTPTDRLAVVTTATSPAETYRYLATNSQIDLEDRLRSDAGSVMDNIWGFPSYAWREAWSDRTLRPLATVATEPILSDYFTPRAGQVYDSVDRETERIGWSEMIHGGLARAVRRRAEGGWFVLVAPAADEHRGPLSQGVRLLRADHVHVAVGYPGVRLLPDLQAFRSDHPASAHRVLNAYEPHEHAYAEARRRPMTVMVRGSGIVASRVVERLLDDVEHGVDVDGQAEAPADVAVLEQLVPQVELEVDRLLAAADHHLDVVVEIERFDPGQRGAPGHHVDLAALEAGE